MTQVLFAFDHPAASGVDAPAAGVIECALAVVEGRNGRTRTTRAFTQALVNGAASVELSPTGPGQAWRFEFAWLDGLAVMFKRVPESAVPLRFDQLESVDPKTLEVTPSNQAAWDATLAEVRELVEGAGAGGGAGVTFAIDPVHPGAILMTTTSATAPPAPVAPAITAEPTGGTVPVNAPLSLTAAASGSPAPSVQWQERLVGVWTDIAGATSPTHTPPAQSVDNTSIEYRAVFTNATGSATTAQVTVRTLNAPVITSQPTSQSVAAGASVTFASTYTGSSVTRMWQRSTDGGTTWANLTPTASYTHNATAGENGYKYRLNVYNLAGNVYSNVVTLTVT